jgi:histone acetyltransferase MYST1
MKKTKSERKKQKSEVEGALSDGTNVLAQMRNKEWHDAKIIGSRPARNIPKSPKSAESTFDYYVHYEGYDRRNDEWISYSRINKEVGVKDTGKKGDHHAKPAEVGDKSITHDPHEGIDER